MNSRKALVAIVIALALTAGAFSFVLARPLGPPPQGSPVPRVITYEGNLDQNGQPAPDGKYTMTFYFFDAPSGGNQLGGPYSSTIDVSQGRFTAEIGTINDDPVFESKTLHLEIWVTQGEDAGAGYKLSPRQKINAAPFAVRAEKAEIAKSATTATSANATVGFEGWTAADMVLMGRQNAAASACRALGYGTSAVPMAAGQTSQDACAAKGEACGGLCFTYYEVGRTSVDCNTSCTATFLYQAAFGCCK